MLVQMFLYDLNAFIVSDEICVFIGKNFLIYFTKTSPVDSGGGGHGSGESVDTVLLEVRDTFEIVCDDSQTVTWCYEEGVLTDDHVTILKEQ